MAAIEQSCDLRNAAKDKFATNKTNCLNYMNKFILSILAAAALFASACSNPKPSAKAGKALEEGFLTPPPETKPRVWWHWMNGNITKEGAMKDIEWMNRVGLGGFQTFDAAFATPQVVDHRLVYMDPEWKEVFAACIRKADSLGMEVAIAASPGWSESGGPWVKPEQAMKKVVWSELDITGPFDGTVPAPPSDPGAFQNISMNANAFSPENSRIHYYKDIALIALRMPEEYKTLSALSPVITSSGGQFDLAQLTDEDYVSARLLPFDGKGSDAWIQYEFPEPQTVYGLSLVGPNGGGLRSFGHPQGEPEENTLLEYSLDGKTYTKITAVQGNAGGVTALSFEPVTARFFRLVYHQPKPQGGSPFPEGVDMGDFPGMFNFAAAVKGVNVAEFRLFTVPRVHRFLEKAAFANTPELIAALPAQPAAGIPAAQVLDISDKMDADGHLCWDPGEGTWKILRFGCSLTGHQNGPASPEATGLEVDKMNADYVRAYFKEYLDMYEDASGKAMGKGAFRYVITDSWEAGAQNWTDRMFEEFTDRCGYDLHTWLPAIAGYVVEDAEKSDRFLWDYRQTIAELNARNHYDVLTDLLAERGMARYSESHENGRAFTGDGMTVKRTAAVPMSAMWVLGLGATGADIRESASVANIYGQQFVAAESLTAGGNAWGYAPEDLKPTADMELAAGLNRFVIHESAHQPLDDYKPGLTLGPFGQWFNRHETWAEEASAWTGYLARSSWMLSRGRNVADILYYYGEDSNITAQYNGRLPELPEGYEFDFVNADALLSDIRVEKGLLTAPSGNTWKVLVLGENAVRMSLPVARALDRLTRSGAVVIGPRPVEDPSLSDDPVAFKETIKRIWSRKNVYDCPVGEAFALLGMASDVTYTRPSAETTVLFRHRDFDGVQIYWLNSRSGRDEDVEVTFRTTGLLPEIWDAASGEIRETSYKTENGTTVVPMHFAPNDALFVVFRKEASAKKNTLPAKEFATLPVEGPWDVSFYGMGAPENVIFENLKDLRDDDNPYIRYYSGTVSYSKTVDLPRCEGELRLDLGEVASLARVSVNGQDLGVVWKHPFSIDISEAAKEGANRVEVNVINLWVNRLVGDQRGDAGQFTHTTQAFYRASSPLKKSGLIGPVTLEYEQK